MTIFKTQQIEKKDEKDPELLTEPLTGEADEIAAPKVVRVTFGPRRSRTYMNLCLIIAALIVLGAGIIGAIFLYRHLSHRVVTGRCGVTYYDEIYHQQSDFLRGDQPISISLTHDDYDMTELYSKMDFFEQIVEASEADQYEKLQIPKFDECEETVVWHDFQKNYTAIVDHSHKNCYVMKLNRTLIAPPKDFVDVIKKLEIDNYYLPRADIVRQKYAVVLPPLMDLKSLGSYIMTDCYWYDTYRLQLISDGIVKRSAKASAPSTQHHYGFLVVHPDRLVKLTIDQF